MSGQGRPSSGVSTRAGLAVRVDTIRVHFENGDGGDGEGDATPRKEIDVLTFIGVGWVRWGRVWFSRMRRHLYKFHWIVI